MVLIDSKSNASYLRGYGAGFVNSYNPNVLLSSFSSVAAVQFRGGATGASAAAQVEGDLTNPASGNMSFDASGGIWRWRNVLGDNGSTQMMLNGGNLSIGGSLKFNDNFVTSQLGALDVTPYIYSDAYLFDMLQWNFPNTYETWNGTTWVSSALPGSIQSLFTGRYVSGLHSIAYLGGAFRVTWTAFVYSWLESFQLQAKTNNHSLAILIETSADGINWSTQVNSTFSGSPTNFFWRKALNTFGLGYIRITFTPAWTGGANPIEFYNIRWMSSYWRSIEPFSVNSSKALYPFGNGVCDLGTSSTKWRHLYLNGSALVDGNVAAAGIFSSLSTGTASFVTSGLDMSSPIAATSNTNYQNSPALLLKASIWSGSMAETKYTGFQTQGVSGISGMYVLGIRSSQGWLGYFDSGGGLSVGPSAPAYPGVSPGYINAESGFTLKGVAAPFVPVGAVIAWLENLTGSPQPSFPAGFQRCDGTLITDTASPYYNTNTPNLNGQGGSTPRFLRGSTTTGSNPTAGFGGSDSHTHGMTATSVSVSSGTGASVCSCPVNTNANIAPTTLPSYYQVVWIMRIK